MKNKEFYIGVYNLSPYFTEYRPNQSVVFRGVPEDLLLDICRFATDESLPMFAFGLLVNAVPYCFVETWGISIMLRHAQYSYPDLLLFGKESLI